MHGNQGCGQSSPPGNYPTFDRQAWRATSVGCSGNAVGSGHAASDRCLGLTDHQAVLDAIERVTIGAKEVEIQLRDANVAMLGFRCFGLSASILQPGKRNFA